MPRKNKKDKSLKAISYKLQSVKTAQQELATNSLAADELLKTNQKNLENISEKVSKIVGVLARNASSVRTIESRATNLELRQDKIEQDVKDIYDYVTAPEEVEEEKSEPTVNQENNSEVVAVKESLSSIATSMSSINNNFNILESLLLKSIEGAKAEEYKKEEALLEAKPTLTDRPVKEKTEEPGSFFSLIKSFFTNPAVIAAFSGLVYLLLPKDIKEKINAFFTGLFTRGDSTSKELSNFEKALAAVGIGLATYLGASFLTKVFDAISVVLTLIKKAKSVLRRFGPKGIAAIAVVAAAGVAYGLTRKKEGVEEGEEDEGADLEEEEGPISTPGAAAAFQKTDKDTTPVAPATTPSLEPPKPVTLAPTTPAPTRSITAAPSTESRAPLGGGITPSTKIGLKVPEFTGEDAPIMAMIKRHEGVRTRPYKDSLGLWTVGVGHLIGDGKSLPPEYNREFTMDEINAMFAMDYEHHKNAAKRIPGFENLNASGRAGLIDLTYNMGPTWYKSWPNFSRNLREGDMEGAAQSLENSKWYTQVGNRAPTVVGLIRSGGKESNLPEMTTGDSMPGNLEEPAINTGAAIAMSTQQVETGYSRSNELNVMNNSIGGTSVVGGERGSTAPPVIPSPVADRGSLALYTRHSTAYT